MPSNVSPGVSSKKRHSFFGHFLSTKNFGLFRPKPSASAAVDQSNPLSKQYRSQIDVNAEQTPIPACIGRGWLKKRAARPLSFDLDLVKDLLIQQDERPRLPFRDLGTIIVTFRSRIESSLRRIMLGLFVWVPSLVSRIQPFIPSICTQNRRTKSESENER